MNDLVERYLYQVGRYLPQAEREDILKELRSLIQDQLDDRGAGEDSTQDVAAVLQELGSPLQMARSYGAEQYLVGPTLYPIMMRVLRTGVYFIPIVVVVVNVVVGLTSTNPTVLSLLLRVFLVTAQALFAFFGIVVLIFAAIQHRRFGIEARFKEKDWNPLDLPATDDPGKVQVDVSGDLAGNILLILVFLYFLRVGGLTLRFNLSDPGTVIPVSVTWLVLYIAAHVGQIGVILLVLRRNRWDVGPRLVNTALELFAIVCGYFAVFVPVWDTVLATLPWLEIVPLSGSGPEIITAVLAFIVLMGGVGQAGNLWYQRNADRLPFSTQAEG